MYGVDYGWQFNFRVGIKKILVRIYSIVFKCFLMIRDFVGLGSLGIEEVLCGLFNFRFQILLRLVIFFSRYLVEMFRRVYLKVQRYYEQCDIIGYIDG